MGGLTNAWITSGHIRTGILMAPAAAVALAVWIGGGGMPLANIADLARQPVCLLSSLGR